MVTANTDLTSGVVFENIFSVHEQLDNSTDITVSTYCRDSGSIVSTAAKLTNTNEHMMHSN